MDPIGRLLETLRDQPASRTKPAEQLAQELGLDPAFVQRIQSHLSGSTTLHLPPIPESMQSSDRGPSVLERGMQRQIEFLLFTCALMAGVLLIRSLLKAVAPSLPGVLAFAWGGALIAIFALQILGLFYTGKVRHSIVAAGAAGLTIGFCASLRFSGGFGFSWKELIVVAILTFIGHAMVSVPCAVLGGYQNIRKEQQKRANLTRQQMLDRLLALRESTSGHQQGEIAAEASGWSVSLRRLQPRIVPISTVFVVVFYAISTFIGYRFDPQGHLVTGQFAGPDQAIGVALAFVSLALVTYVFHAVIGFISGNVVRALTITLYQEALTLALMCLPIGPYSAFAMGRQFLNQAIMGVLYALVSGVVGGLAATIDDMTRLSSQRRQNDPSALYAEMLEFEIRLRPQTNRVVVMVVDAAQSSVMKAEADPFAAEWSFREYQAFLASISAAHHGSVHATAGDGAVVGFPDAYHALCAARQIQAEIGTFNAQRSRLQMPFRLRIGLHSGNILGNLDQVQFTEVIDIAAHVEQRSPVGGIALTERVLEDLKDVQAHPLDELVDNQRVYILSTARFEV